MMRLSIMLGQGVLAITFLVIPLSRLFGFPTLGQVLALGIPMWLVWIANIVEVSGATLLLLGLRLPICTLPGSFLITASMIGATLAHMRVGNLFEEVPWTLVFLGLCLLVVLLQWPVLLPFLRRR